MLADLRRYFGLPQWEVAGLLRVSEDYYRLLELEKRTLNIRQMGRILPLLQAVPATLAAHDRELWEPSPPALPVAVAVSGTASPYQNAVEGRLDYCRHTAWKLRLAAHTYAVQARVAARWAEALPTLRATEPFYSEQGVAEWLAAREVALSPTALSKWHLLLARATGLDAEAAELTTLLGA